MAKVDNALILAAGYSSRFVPICFDTSKALIPLHGQTLIERQINQLHDIGISEIYIVTGAYREQFDYIKKKHGVNLIYNKDYSTKNNFASIYAAKDILKNTIISSGDLFFPNNIFQNESKYSYYLSVFSNGTTKQRSLTLDKNDKIIKTTYGGKNCWITFGGQAFLTKELSKLLVSYITPVYDNPEYANKYWVDFQDEHLNEMPMYIKRITSNDIVEFNTLADLQKFDNKFSAYAFSKTMKYLCDNLNISENDLKNFEPIKEGNCSIGCKFTYKNSCYNYIHKTKSIFKCT